MEMRWLNRTDVITLYMCSAALAFNVNALFSCTHFSHEQPKLRIASWTS